MRSTLVAVLIAAAVVMGGCTSGVNRGPGIQDQKLGISSSNQISAVSLTFTEEAKQKATENLKFNADELLGQLKRALEANAFLAPTDQTRPALEVRLKDVRVRSNFSAIMFGFMAGADTVAADVIVKNAAGKEIDRFEVAASYALGGLAGGQDSARLSWLYEKFAEETIKELKKQ